jgi:hypothetical protein
MNAPHHQAGTMKLRTTQAPALLLAAFSLILAGCSDDGRSSSAAAAPLTAVGQVSSALPAPSRDSAGYSMSVYFSAPSVPGAGVSALVAPLGSATELLVGEAPLGRVFATTGALTSSALALETDLFFDVASLSAVTSGAENLVYAATRNLGTPGAGDVHRRSSDGAWSIVIDGQGSSAALAAVNGSLFAATGAGDGSCDIDVLSPAPARVASIQSAIPTAAVGFQGALWVGTTGPDPQGDRARLFRVRAGAVEELGIPVASIGPGVSQRVTDMISFHTVGSQGAMPLVALAVGEFDSLGSPLAGAVLISTGREFEVVGSFRGDSPTCLAWIDDTLYVGTAQGTLQFRDDQGVLQDEPALPACQGVHSLLVSGPDLYVGAASATGPVVYLRSGMSVGPSYVADVAPLLDADCASCHKAGALPSAASFPLSDPVDHVADYDQAARRVNLSTPAASLLLVKASDGALHAGGALWLPGSAEYAAVEAWIAAGAPFQGAPVGGGSMPNFKDHIFPILRADCSILACHGGNVGSSTYVIDADLEGSYDGTLLQVDQIVPERSPLLVKSAEGSSHPGGPVPGWERGSQNYALTLRWIQGGAERGFQPGTGGPAPITFHDYVYPVLRNTCGAAGCHGTAPGAGGLRIDFDEAASYDSVVRRVDAGTPTRSALLRKPAEDGVTHGGGVIPLHDLSGANYDLVLQWINDGQLR